ncbi:hypothetical protein FLLO111716_04585 [Flavobacterium longum]|uniref:T9SS type A sorting domain-containing protein n=1 Tax=Flavobacterium longum TaxID=1299340 RepID=UPI0039EBF2A0
MKHFYYSLFLTLLFFVGAKSQQSCVSAEPLCLNNGTLTLSNTINVNTAEGGIDYDCLFQQPNPYWLLIKVAVAGNLEFQLTQSNLSGVPTDIDFILWGPFPDPSQSCGPEQLNQGTEVACSYSNNLTETFSIPNAQAGEFYKLLVTNFSNQFGTFTITQTNIGQPGSGSSNCDIPCPLTVMGDGTSPCPITNLWASPAYAGATYQWSSLESGLLDETGQFLTVTEPGTYTVTVTAPGCISPMTATGVVYPYALEHPEANDLTACSSVPTAIFDLSTNEAIVLGGLDESDFSVIGFFHTEQDAFNGIFPILNPSTYNGTDGEVIYYAIENMMSGCISVGDFMLHVVSGAPAVEVSVSDQTATILIQPDGNYQYSLDGGATWSSSNIFTDLPMGDYTVTVQYACGTTTQDFSIVTPNAPFGNSPQFFTAGQTLANLVMTGQNIQWYDSAGRMLSDTPLPLSTLLQGNTTYFATQTVNGAESTNRFPVLALSVLSSAGVAFNSLVCHPNPAKTILFVSNGLPIESFEVFSLLGQRVANSRVNHAQIQIDLSPLANGVYFVRLKAAGTQKTIRVVKE